MAQVSAPPAFTDSWNEAFMARQLGFEKMPEHYRYLSSLELLRELWRD